MVELFSTALASSFALVTAFALHLGLPQNIKLHNTGAVLTLRLVAWMFLLIYGVALALFLPVLLWVPLGGFPMGWLLLTAALLGVVATLTVFALQRWSGTCPQSALARASSIAEDFWLLGLSAPRREQYEWHGRWRLEVFFRRIKRRWEGFNWRRDLPNLRWLVVLLAAAASLLAFHSLLKNGLNAWLNRMMDSDSAGMATLQITLLGAAVGYVIWLFRDINLREQIENQRKDVNLKDFQRLAEWAAGLHLPEDKIVAGEKTADGKTETTRTTETWAGMKHAVLPAPSRREGAASLQIAAIYQLQTFLNGEYGRYFQRPAFQLLKSIWLALTSRHLAAWESDVMTPCREDCPLLFESPKVDPIGDGRWNMQGKRFRDRLSKWQDGLRATTQTALFQAINAALGQAHGALLRQHQEDLPRAHLIGYRGMRSLELDSLSGLNLPGVQFHGANLRGTKLHGVGLSGAKFHGADLREAELHGAYLRGTELYGADLAWAQLHGADLVFAELHGADLTWADFRGADLREARIHGADLSEVQLHGADLRGVRFYGSLLLNPAWDGRTIWGDGDGHAIADENTRIFRAKKKATAGREFPADYDIDAPATFALRRELRERGLDMHDILHRRLYATDAEDHPDGDKP